MRKAFREHYGLVAARFAESQSDRFPEEYRQREGAAILKELATIEAQQSRDMLLWHHAQRVEAARLRQQDPMGDPAPETRRLREQMEVASLAEQYPSRVQAQNFLLPDARTALAAGNVTRAAVLYEAAKRRQAFDGELEHGINLALDRTVPHRRQAVEVEVAAADELELSRRDVAAARLTHKIGSPIELVRASNTVQMTDYKRKQEAPVLKEQLGIELPASAGRARFGHSGRAG